MLLACFMIETRESCVYVCSCGESQGFILGFANVVPAEWFSAEFVRFEASDAEKQSFWGWRNRAWWWKTKKRRRRRRKKQRAFGAEELFSFTEDWRRRKFLQARKQAVRVTDLSIRSLLADESCACLWCFLIITCRGRLTSVWRGRSDSSMEYSAFVGQVEIILGWVKICMC